MTDRINRIRARLNDPARVATDRQHRHDVADLGYMLAAWAAAHDRADRLQGQLDEARAERDKYMKLTQQWRLAATDPEEARTDA